MEKISIAGTYIVWKNKLLIHKRNTTGSEASWNKLAAPGGKLEKGEDFLTAAIRELQEESGLVLTKRGFKVLNTIQSDAADSIMYIRNLSKKPVVGGPQDSGSKKAIDMKFTFDSIEGESAGPGYYWADIESLLGFLDKNKEYNNPYFYKNIVLVQKYLKKNTLKGKTLKKRRV